MIRGQGYFDMGSLPNYQQKNRLKTVPFVNHHDAWRGAYWNSRHAGSTEPSDTDNDQDPAQNKDELAPTIDPDDPRADLAYAVALAVDGSPMVYYEDLFVNRGQNRTRVEPQNHPTRNYVQQLVWCHQKLNFKDGAYKVRHQASDLLVIERSGKALIVVNDNGTQEKSAWVQTDFGANAELHNYTFSEQPPANIRTNDHGWVELKVPQMEHQVWAPAGIQGGFSPAKRRTTQEFQLADDLGDSQPQSLGYGGHLVPREFRTGGAVWVAAGTAVKIELYADNRCSAQIRAQKPDTEGRKSIDQGAEQSDWREAAPHQPLVFTFTADREGYYLFSTRLADGQQRTIGYLKVEYEAPSSSPMIR